MYMDLNIFEMLIEFASLMAGKGQKKNLQECADGKGKDEIGASFSLPLLSPSYFKLIVCWGAALNSNRKIY